ncbi:hypothetical protein J2X65_001676 [Ancylobacter sp. 3268]|uniref:hypothetical protein n=1 Tax=Ancylobacter sp. 3268 TaxID=2817752 RepID=UPI002855B97B|nr:hypothetical protein [Ancylobacter sp. 3268]MDR6952321.1 hypothetical protein [Ancylobacter sp. 3268]
MKHEPASSLIEKLGGPTAVALAVGCNLSRVYRWTYSKEAGGTGGIIPQRHYPALIDEARRKGITLTINDFLPRPALAAEPLAEETAA